MSETASTDDEILNALMRALRALKRNVGILAVAAILGGASSVLWAVLSDPYYTASTTLVASSAVAQSNPANSALSTLSSLAGGVGATKELSPFERLQLVLNSAGLAKAVLADEKAREVLFPDRWDSANHSWSQPGGLVAVFRSLLGQDEPLEPDPATATRALARHLKISIDSTAGSVQLTFSAKNSDAALYMLRLVLQKADDIVRRDYLVVAQGYSDYILKLLPTIDNVVSRSALTDQLSRYQETVVMARVNLPFAELAIDPPSVPAKPSGPQPLLYLAAGLAAGSILGIIYVLLRPWLTLRFIPERNSGFPAPSTPPSPNG